jgi:hypothetical protein
VVGVFAVMVVVMFVLVGSFEEVVFSVNRQWFH